MIVRLTHRDLAAARYWGTDRHKAFLANPVAVGKRTVDAAMPYAAWLALRNTLREQAFSRSGRGRPSKLTGDMAGTRHALTKIQAELNAMDVHPALRGELVVGASDLHIPAWFAFTNREGGWALAPIYDGSMMVFVPWHRSAVVTAHGTTFRPPEGVTQWSIEPRDKVRHPVPGLFLDEDDHRGWL